MPCLSVIDAYMWRAARRGGAGGAWHTAQARYVTKLEVDLVRADVVGGGEHGHHHHGEAERGEQAVVRRDAVLGSAGAGAAARASPLHLQRE